MTAGIDAAVERLRGQSARHLDALRSLVEVQSVSRMGAVEPEMDEAAQQIYDAWEAITEEIGRDSQLASYKATIGAK